MALSKNLQFELLLGCAYCGKRFIDARSIKKDWKSVKYLHRPISITISGQPPIFICKQCFCKTVK